MSSALHTIQLEQALFEIHLGVAGSRRAIDRLVAATIVGGPVVLAGPRGVGKSHLIDTVSRVFGLGVTPPPLGPALPVIPAPYQIYVADLDLLDSSGRTELLDFLSGANAANVVITTAAARPTVLSMPLRDALLGFIEVSYPTADEESALALDAGARKSSERILHRRDLAAIRSEAMRMPIAGAVVAYAVSLVQATRAPGSYGLASLAPLLRGGVSPRASISLVRAARGLAMIAGRGEATAQDVYDAAFEVLVHRLDLSARASDLEVTAEDAVVELLSRVPVNSPR